jgi:excisionase family DNA binding protein
MTTDRARIAQPPADPAPDRGGVDDLLTVDDVCAWFKVTRDWVYDEVEAGRLPYVRLGRKHLRFHRHELTNYLTAATRRPSARSRTPTTTIPDALEPLE